MDIDRSLVKRVSFSYARRFSLLPLRAEGDTVVVAAAHPEDFQPIDDLRLLLNAPVRAVFMDEKELLDLINKVYHEAATDEDATFVLEEVSDVAETKDLLESSADDAPAVRLLNSLLSRGLQRRASDIHFEPLARGSK